METELLEGVLRDSPLAVTVVDAARPGLPIVYANDAWRGRNGNSAAVATGRLSLIDDTLEGNDKAVATVRAALRNGRACTVVVHVRRADGATGYDEIDFYPVHAGDLRLYAAVHRDVSGQIATERRLRATNKTLLRLALHDGLTGIYNRQFFDKMFEREWRVQARVGGALALLMMDIDGFKRYNDERGHHAGDNCLRAVAATLDTSLRRGSDFVARYGGDEFVALLTGVETGKARQLAELIRARVAATPVGDALDGGPVTLTIGVAVAHPGPDCSASDLLDSADNALYRAKAAGKNRVAINEPKKTARARRRGTGSSLPN